jgi:hypothetical protein
MSLLRTKHHTLDTGSDPRDAPAPSPAEFLRNSKLWPFCDFLALLRGKAPETSESQGG